MRTVRVLSWNVNGIRAALRNGFGRWFQETQPDVLCLQEIKITEDLITDGMRQVDGYHAYFCCGERKGYSGVALYSREEPLEVSYGMGIEEFDREGRMIVARYPSFTLLNTYYPNGRSSLERLDYKMRFYDAFLEFVNGLRANGEHLVITGDVNTAHKEIDIARPGPNSKVSGFLPQERAWMDQFISHGYVDTFRMFCQEGGHYTFWDTVSRARERNIGWRIDYFFVDDDLVERVKNAWIMPEVMGSDHCPIGVEIDLAHAGADSSVGAGPT